MNSGNSNGEMVLMNDAGSLQNLNDIVVPGPVPLWPLAPGWYVVAGLLLVFAIYRILRMWRQRRQNRYRKQALQVLSSIRKDGSAASLQALPGLIKRAALAVWPREQVAQLSGTRWHQFLDESTDSHYFREGAGNTLDWLAYHSGREHTPPPEAIGQVLDAVEYWLKNHRRSEPGD